MLNLIQYLVQRHKCLHRRDISPSPQPSPQGEGAEATDLPVVPLAPACEVLNQVQDDGCHTVTERKSIFVSLHLRKTMITYMSWKPH